MDSQQYLFTQVKTKLEDKGLDVYDGFLPPSDTPYPFIYLGNCTMNESNLKGTFRGSIRLHIDVWHNCPEQRGTVSNLVAIIKEVVNQVAKEKNNYYTFLLSELDNGIMIDNTTNEPLIHGYVEVVFSFIRNMED